MKYLSYIFLTILSLVFVSCGDDDGLPEPDGGNSLGTGQVNFDFSGESYEVNGLGYVSVVDTFINFAIEDSTGTLNYDTLYNQAISFGIIDYQDDSFTPRKVFGALIVNYDGPGTYPYFGFNGNVEDSGLWWIFYSQYTDDGVTSEEAIYGGLSLLYSDDQNYSGSIVITKDNNNLLEGTFSVDAYSHLGVAETVNTMAGSFSIEK